MKIYLIGMPGVGKSTIAKKLALKIKYALVDLDLEVERLAGMSIREIFSKNGETYFRSLETKALEGVKDKDNLVIATGGGIVENLKNKSLMEGIIIYLSLPLKELEKRIDYSSRPLFKSNSLLELYQRRENKYYYFAKHIVSNYVIEDTVLEIIRRLNYENFNN